MDIAKDLANWFKEKNIKNRNDLRRDLKIALDKFPYLNQPIIEGYFSLYKSSLTTDEKVNVVAISDFHVPFQNKEFVKNFIEFISDYKPGKLIIVGDFVDFYDLSRFDKDPSRVGNLQKELDIAFSILYLLRKASPSTEIILVEGNHEDRLRKYLWKNSSVASIRELKLERLLRLDEIDNVTLVGSYELRGVIFTHGDLVRKHSCYSAKAEFEKYLKSGVSGHTHRLGFYNMSTCGKDNFWLEIGCACEPTMEYVSNPNWQNGFAILEFDNEQVFPTIVKASNNRFSVNGKIYG